MLHNQIQRYKKFDQVWKDDIDWSGRSGLFGNCHCGVRGFGSGRARVMYTIAETTDHSSVGGGGCEDEDEGDIGESESWLELGEMLAAHYWYELKNGRLMWPKSQRLCAGRLDFQ